jgi:hypothetical protein
MVALKSTGQQVEQAVLAGCNTARLEVMRQQNRVITSGAAKILAAGPAANVCSDVHGVVWEFRKAHGLSADADSQERQEVIGRYTLDRAPAQERQSIEQISSPEVYGKLRKGGRIEPFYPAVSESLLRSLCAEIRAAFVWKALEERSR